MTKTRIYPDTTLQINYSKQVSDQIAIFDRKGSKRPKRDFSAKNQKCHFHRIRKPKLCAKNPKNLQWTDARSRIIGNHFLRFSLLWYFSMQNFTILQETVGQFHLRTTLLAPLIQKKHFKYFYTPSLFIFLNFIRDPWLFNPLLLENGRELIPTAPRGTNTTH